MDVRPFCLFCIGDDFVGGSDKMVEFGAFVIDEACIVFIPEDSFESRKFLSEFNGSSFYAYTAKAEIAIKLGDVN